MKKIYGLKYVADFEISKPQYTLIYSFKEKDDKYDLLTKFTNKYEKKYSKQIKFALLRLKRMVNQRGLELDQFENESEDGNLPIYKLIQTGNLRLYFIVVNSITIIFGGGDEKFVKKWQDDPKLCKIIRSLEKIIKIIDSQGIKITKENAEDIFFELDE